MIPNPNQFSVPHLKDHKAIERLLRYAILAQITPRSRAAQLVCLKKYSAIGNSAMENYIVLCSKLIQKQCY